MWTKLMYIAVFAILFLLLAGAFLLGRGARRSGAQPEEQLITVGSRTFRVEVRDTALGRAQGLSGRERLAQDTGMLFVFSRASDYEFWMKDMKFAIDIIWIQENASGERAVAWITENVQPEPDKSLLTLTVHRPPEPVRYVLELPAGAAAEYGLKEGDNVVIQ